ncbi:MAG: SPFH domain-containing protein [Planctomycetota bacterium]
MKADHLAYQRASSVSLAGLAFQFALALITLIYGIMGEDPAAVSGSVIIFIGIPMWVALWLIFFQHRRERLEALENESYQGAMLAESSVFDEDSRGHNIQQERLELMHKWLMPAVGLMVALLYIGFGIFLFVNQREAMQLMGANIPVPPNTGWAMAIGFGLAAVSFIFARYIAGMAKQTAWSLLNAGAAASVGAAIVGVGLVVAFFAKAAFGSSAIIHVLPLVFDVVLILLGVEVVLNFLLTAYRPRKPGEIIRPAFDSRVLAFVAAPDRLAESIADAVNYQFGFNVSSTWFYRLLSRSIAFLVLIALGVGWLLSSFTVVEPDEKAIILVNGEVRENADGSTVVGPGLKITPPWPFAEVIRYPAEALSSFEAGHNAVREDDKPILWTTEATGEVQYFLVRSQRTDVAGSDGVRGFGLLTAEVPIQYRVSDLDRYIRLAQDAQPIYRETARALVDDPERHRRGILRVLSSRIVTQELSRYDVSQLMGDQRDEVRSRMHERIQEAFDTLNNIGAGVEVVFVGLNGVHPEAEVSTAFEQIVKAPIERQRAIDEARKDQIEAYAKVVGDVATAERFIEARSVLNRMKSEGASREDLIAQEQLVTDLLTNAGGQAAELVFEARADRWERSLREFARLQSSSGKNALYEAAPSVYFYDVYLDARADSIEGARLWISSFETEVRYNTTRDAFDLASPIDPAESGF